MGWRKDGGQMGGIGVPGNSVGDTPRKKYLTALAALSTLSNHPLTNSYTKKSIAIKKCIKQKKGAKTCDFDG